MFRRLLDPIWYVPPTPKVTDNTLIYVMIISASVVLVISIAAMVYHLYKKNKKK